DGPIDLSDVETANTACPNVRLTGVERTTHRGGTYDSPGWNVRLTGWGVGLGDGARGYQARVAGLQHHHDEAHRLVAHAGVAVRGVGLEEHGVAGVEDLVGGAHPQRQRACEHREHLLGTDRVRLALQAV